MNSPGDARTVHSTLGPSRSAPSLLRVGLLSLLAITLLGATPALPEGDDFGSGITLSSARALSTVMSEADVHTAKPVLVRGQISEVCQKKGCWTILRDGDSFVRVRFKDYGFFLPKDVSGREALVEGIVAIRTLSESEARHYASETRGGRPNEIHGAQREIGFVATGVRVLPRGD